MFRPYGYHQSHLFHFIATWLPASDELFCLRHGKEEVDERNLTNMTLSKPGHNRSRGDSASPSIHEGTPEIQDGPEGYSEDAPSWESEDDQNETSYANLSIRRAKTWLRITGITDIQQEVLERIEVLPWSHRELNGGA